MATYRQFPDPSAAIVLDEPLEHPPVQADQIRRLQMVQRLRTFLRDNGTTLYQVSQATERTPFGKSTRWHIRDAFYAELEGGQTPDIYQVAAMARITGYRLVDWLALFGYPVDAIPRLQLSVHHDRTVILPSTVYDPLVQVPWVRKLDTSISLDRMEPLGRFVDAVGYETIGALETLNQRHYLYARVGATDDMLRSRLAPGSIVRVDPTRTTVAPVGAHRPIYLVQHLGGLCCCYVEQPSPQHLLLVPDEGSTRIMRFRLGMDAVILGTIDAELHPMRAWPPARETPVRERSALSTRPRSHGGNGHPLTLAAMTRQSRERIGLCFRQAQAMTKVVAEKMGDADYSIALGSLSDAETKETLPRHIPKVFSLCVIYAMDFWEYLRAGGIPVDELRGRPIPREILTPDAMSGDSMPFPASSSAQETDVTLRTVMSTIGEVPFFLHGTLGEVLGQDEVSLDDVFVCGRRERPLHPLLEGARVLIVNRRQRRLTDITPKAPGAQRPLVMVRTPSGRLICGMCTVLPEAEVLVVQPHNSSRTGVSSFPLEEVEIIGCVSGMIREVNGSTHRGGRQ